MCIALVIAPEDPDVLHEMGVLKYQSGVYGIVGSLESVFLLCDEWILGIRRRRSILKKLLGKLRRVDGWCLSCIGKHC